MIANELDYNELYGNITTHNDVVAAKCRCVACNSCSCGRCTTCIGQCTGCTGTIYDEDIQWDNLDDENEWEVA